MVLPYWCIRLWMALPDWRALMWGTVRDAICRREAKLLVGRGLRAMCIHGALLGRHTAWRLSAAA